MKLRIGILLMGLAIIGCRTNQTSGRLDLFVLNEAKAYGGRGQPRQVAVELSGNWGYSRDQLGTVIQCNDVTFQEVDQFFRSLYGDPKEAGTNAEGQPQWVIPAKVAGVSFWYSKLGDGVRITVLKALNMK